MDDIDYCKLLEKLNRELNGYRERIVSVIGATGATGATGPTGATGASLDSAEVACVSTVSPEEPADVKLIREDNRLSFEFSIPRGMTGASEKVLAGVAKSIDAESDPQVVDRYEGDKHFIDFFVPKGATGATGERGKTGDKGDAGDKGEPGEKGEKGDQGPRGFPGEIGISEVITIDGTVTVGPDEVAEVQDDFERNIHHLTFYIPQGKQGEKGVTGQKGEMGPKGETGPMGETGPRGERGEQGNTGVAGPPGLTPDIGATVYSSDSQTITNNTAIKLDKTEHLSILQLSENSLVATRAGTYLINFSINNGTGATTGDSIGLAINGQVVESSKRPLTVSTNTSATLIKRLQASDKLTLVPQIGGGRTLNASGAPSAMLTAMLIAL